MPAMRDPPPTGTKIASSGRAAACPPQVPASAAESAAPCCRVISMPTVALPAMMHGSSRNHAITQSRNHTRRRCLR
eukprot:3493993-Prymnesium_polylepis.1